MTEHDLYKDKATLKQIENGYIVLMSAQNKGNQQESYTVETYFSNFEEAWKYLSQFFIERDWVTIKVGV